MIENHAAEKWYQELLRVGNERDALKARVAELEAENERLNSLIRKVSKGGVPDRWRTFEGVCDYLYINHEK